MRGFIVGTAITAIAFYVLTKLLPDAGIYKGVTYDGALTGLIVLAVIFGIVNGLIGPLVRTLAIPVSLVTMGLVGFLVNVNQFSLHAMYNARLTRAYLGASRAGRGRGTAARL